MKSPVTLYAFPYLYSVTVTWAHRYVYTGRASCAVHYVQLLLSSFSLWNTMLHLQHTLENKLLKLMKKEKPNRVVLSPHMISVTADMHIVVYVPGHILTNEYPLWCSQIMQVKAFWSHILSCMPTMRKELSVQIPVLSQTTAGPHPPLCHVFAILSIFFLNRWHNWGLSARWAQRPNGIKTVNLYVAEWVWLAAAAP